MSQVRLRWVLTVARLIRPLLGVSRPPAIFRLVIPIVINAVNAEIRRGQAHVGDKGIIVIAPPIADTYATPPIPVKSRSGWHIAARNHAAVNPIGARPRPFIGVMKMRPRPLRRGWPTCATAGRTATTKVDQPNQRDGTAITSAFDHPHDPLFRARHRCRLRDHSPFAELLAG